MHRTQNDRVLDFIEQDQITQLIHSKPGLTFNPDGSLSQTPANVAAMGRHYFDRPPPTYAQPGQRPVRSEEHTSELQSLMRISYAVFCLQTKKQPTHTSNNNHIQSITTQ